MCLVLFKNRYRRNRVLFSAEVNKEYADVKVTTYDQAVVC